MNPLLYLILPLVMFSCANESDSAITQNKGISINETPSANDSTWITDEYTNENLSIRIINHHLSNFSIQLKRNTEIMTLDLNELKIPFKTTEIDWVSDEMICISNWWSGPFARNIFIPLNGKLNEYIYIDKDIELADSSTNTVI